MIKYNPGTMGLFFVIRWKGSVFPKALVWAIPNMVLAIVFHLTIRPQAEKEKLWDMEGVDVLWAGYTSVLGFLVVFRNNQAYTRFWEGATLINQVRGEWFNAVSTLFAFCNHGKEFQPQVETFQHTLVRLASMLYCSALQQVCDLNDDTLEIIENQGMDPESLSFMQDCNDRCEILLQWIQRLIVDSEEAKTIKIAPPLLTRAFQELSRGIVNLNNARKIKDIPFPFPYAQMITCMLVVHWLVTPLLASQVIESYIAAGVVCFFVTFAFWCLIYIALEIDQPFGEDANDLPLREMQRDFNQSLLNLMHPLAQKPPTYQPNMAEHKLLRAFSTSASRSLDGLGGQRRAAEEMSGTDSASPADLEGMLDKDTLSQGSSSQPAVSSLRLKIAQDASILRSASFSLKMAARRSQGGLQRVRRSRSERSETSRSSSPGPSPNELGDTSEVTTAALEPRAQPVPVPQAVSSAPGGATRSRRNQSSEFATPDEAPAPRSARSSTTSRRLEETSTESRQSRCSTATPSARKPEAITQVERAWGDAYSLSTQEMQLCPTSSPKH